MRIRHLIAAVIPSLIIAPLHAEVNCAAVFSSHMVLQNGCPVPVWGTAAAGEKISIEFAGKKATATAANDGRWLATLPALPVNKEPQTLRVNGSNELRFEDVLVGEVWLCSGQSNMEKPLGNRKGQRPTDNAVEEIAKADHPLLRLFQMPRGGRKLPDDLTLQWNVCTPEVVDKVAFSAAGYFFGRDLKDALNTPVGMIHTSVGGTRIEPWTEPSSFDGVEGLEEFANSAKGDRRIDGIRIGDLYDSMVKPLAPFALRGFLWYQGESNLCIGDSRIYTAKMRALVGGWRRAWNMPAAPFYYVQLAPYLYSARKQDKLLSADALPLFREAQARALEISHTGMAVVTDTVDHPSDIHPTNKKAVGERLAKIALARTYGKAVADSGPVFNDIKIRGNQAAVRFENSIGLKSRDGKPLTDFTLAGKDQVFHPAEARIKEGYVVITSASVNDPVAVRFAWSETANPNLVNADGLPARGFRTDTWPASVLLENPVVAPVR